ncbi:MAG: SDR family oxidoreductase, partial [Deltaproteobacteria bacterium]|nr:SDR family oxidoreductase [Deltaproteobacteria bacterium]
VRNFPFDFTGLGFSHVLHVATPSVAPEDLYPPLELLEIIVTGTWRMLELARRCGARRFLLTSSGAIYGRQPPETTHLDEDHPGAPHLLDPGSAYAQGKRLAEHLCSQYHRHHGLHCTIARGFAFVGPHLPLDAHYAIGNFLRDGLAGGPVVVQGDGTPYRSYLHAADLAAWLWTILLRGRPCRPYNVGSEDGLPLAEVAGRVAACCSTEVIIRRAPAPVQPPAGRRAATARRGWDRAWRCSPASALLRVPGAGTV